MLSHSDRVHPVPERAEEETGGHAGDAQEGGDGSEDHQRQLRASHENQPGHVGGRHKPIVGRSQVPSGKSPFH